MASFDSKNRRRSLFGSRHCAECYTLSEALMKASNPVVPVSDLTERPVWLTGAGGLIGNYLLKTAQAYAPHFRIIPLTRNRLDLADINAVQQAFNRQKPQLVIHCAALSKSPACQANPALAQKLNVEVTAHLALLAAEIPFFFFSSDLVFDGRRGNYAEVDPINPLSVYAETKAAAEKIVLANPLHTVIRTSLNGGISPTGDRGFNEEMRHAWQQHRTPRLFTDEFRCPIPAVATALAVWELVGRSQPGLYHVAGSERLSRWEIGQLLATRWPQLNPKLEAASLKEYHGAPRSPDTSLNCAKVKKLLSFPLPGLTQWLAANPNEPF
jgi:dTDP-4-dehydrorhamnose reductase